MCSILIVLVTTQLGTQMCYSFHPYRQQKVILQFVSWHSTFLSLPIENVCATSFDGIWYQMQEKVVNISSYEAAITYNKVHVVKSCISLNLQAINHLKLTSRWFYNMPQQHLKWAIMPLQKYTPTDYHYAFSACTLRYILLWHSASMCCRWVCNEQSLVH